MTSEYYIFGSVIKHDAKRKILLTKLRPYALFCGIYFSELTNHHVSLPRSKQHTPELNFSIKGAVRNF